MSKTWGVLCLVGIFSVCFPGPTRGGLHCETAVYRSDRYPVPVDAHQWMEGWAEYRQFFPRYFKPAGTIHLFLVNRGSAPVDVTGLTFDGKPIEKVCTTPEFAGPVIWYRVNPETLRPGQTGIVYLRLRNQLDKPIDVTVAAKDGSRISVRVGPENAEQLRLGYVGFNRTMDKIFIYVDRLADRPLTVAGLFLDGRELTAACRIINGAFEANRPALIEVTLPAPLVYGAYHGLKVVTKEGPVALHQVRVRDDKFLIGIIGGNRPAYYAKFFNTTYQLHGSFPETPGWWNPDSEAAKLDFTMICPAPSEKAARAGATVPPGKILYTNVDEPDAREPGHLPYMDRSGINIMHVVEPVMRMQRKLDPVHPTALMMDRTYAPLNWLNYGEVADEPFNDIYVPTQFHGFKMEAFPVTLAALLSAVAPRPIHIMLWSCWNTGHAVRRAPTPDENDLSVHYVLGGGAKGLHYFLDWNSYPMVLEGGYFIGAPRATALWKAMGRLNAEVTRLAPLLARGYPFDVVRSESDKVWARSLLCGKDHFVVFLVNRNYHCYPETLRQGLVSYLFPVKDVSVAVDLPSWFTPAAAVHVAWDQVTPISLTKGKIRVPELKTSMVIVLSRDPRIADRLALDPKRLALLRESEKPGLVTNEPPIADAHRPEAVLHLDAAAIKKGTLTLDLTQADALARATRIKTTGELRPRSGNWLGLFPPPGQPGEAEIVFTIRSDVPLKKITAALAGQTPNFGACARNLVGLSRNGRAYVEEDSFSRIQWNGGISGERLSATLTGEAITDCYLRVLMRDPGMVASDEATNLLERVDLTLDPAKPGH